MGFSLSIWETGEYLFLRGKEGIWRKGGLFYLSSCLFNSFLPIIKKVSNNIHPTTDEVWDAANNFSLEVAGHPYITEKPIKLAPFLENTVQHCMGRSMGKQWDLS